MYKTVMIQLGVFGAEDKYSNIVKRNESLKNQRSLEARKQRAYTG